MKKTAVITALAVGLGGCATASKDVATAYVSPVQYQNLDCEQIAVESHRLGTRVQQLGGRLDEAASNDKAIMGVGMLLFWPALFALGGTKEQEAEYARLKGEGEALQQVALSKKCGLAGPGNAMTSTVAPAAVVPAAAVPAVVAPAATSVPATVVR